MPSFRSATAQAQHAAAQMARHGTSRAEARQSGGVPSIGTQRSYQDPLRQYAAWLHEQPGRPSLAESSPEQARAYLQERAASGITQTTLDRHRQALAAHYQQQGQALGIERRDLQAARETGRLATQSRHYTPAQIERIAARQSPANALATRVAAEAGLRAAEIPTLARRDERPPTEDRDWHPERGRPGTVVYTVSGKGGLVREVYLSPATAARLEAARRDQPTTITDRGIHRVSRYEIGGGNAWSLSFSRTSRTELGWTAGAHAVRHTYAQQRMHEVQARGHTYDDARAIVAQELGHFRSTTTEAYLR